MIRSRDLTRRFGSRSVVDQVSLQVEPGEVVGLLGPNGAGKTTVLKLLASLLRPHAGSVSIDGRIGYLPERFAAYDALSVSGYLQFCRRMKRLGSSTVADAMAMAGVEDLARRPVGRLSEGQRQRVGLAQAMLGGPSALLLDEPTVGLDPRQVVDTRGLIRSAADDGAAVLVSTHLLAEASSICDRVVVIVDGSIVAEEEPGDPQGLEERFLGLLRPDRDGHR